MKARCLNQNFHAYADYGGRGIKVCERWASSFEAFLNDMGPRPSDRHQIDRINNDGDYEPSNCRWVTNSENSNNKRSNRMLTYDGQTMTLTQWAREVDVDRHVLLARIDQLGWTVERALTEPVKSNPPVVSADRVIEYDGHARTIREWATVTGIGWKTIAARLDVYGYSASRALTTPSRRRASPA